MKYALILEEGSTFSSNDGAEFILDSDVNFKLDTEFEPLEVSVYSINNMSNKPEYYLLKKKVKAISGEVLTQTFSIGAPERFKTINNSNLCNNIILYFKNKELIQIIKISSYTIF